MPNKYDEACTSLTLQTKHVYLQDKTGDSRKTYSSTFLYIAAFTANITYFAFGCNLVWTSPVIAKLRSEDAQENPLGIPTTHTEIAIIAGLPFFGSIIGPLLLGRLCDVYGRRYMLTVSATITFISYLILAFANSVYLYFLSRLLLGMCQGLSAAILPIFIAEIASKDNRGRLVCLSGLFVVIGNFYGLSVGHFFSVRVFTLLCATPMIFCIIMMIFVVPESPHFLVSKGETIKALRALEKLRNRIDVIEEYEEIKSTLKNKFESKSGALETLCKDAVNRKAFVINIVIAVLQVMSGTNVILAFVGPLLDSTNSGLSGNVLAIMVGIARVITFTLASTMVESAGRKKLLLVSSIGSGITHACLGTFFYLKSSGYSIADAVAWLPILLVVSFAVFYSLGLGPLPPVVMSEIQPSETKAVASSIITSIGCGTAFASTSGFPFLVEILGYHGCFWLFSGCCIMGSIYIIFFVLETKGKTLLEIQESLKLSS